MKKLILILMLVLLPVFAFANPTPTANVTFAWDANTDTVTGYRLYQRSEFGSYTYGEGNEVGTTLAGTEIVTIQVKDGKWYWVVTAQNPNGESDPSNEVTDTIDTSVPHAPGGLKITIIIKIE